MKTLIIFSLIATLSSCAHTKKKPATDKEIDQYCQDLNVLYQKASVIQQNIANINTTRTAEGGYYKRQIARDCKAGFCKIEQDQTTPLMKYEPKSPDANKQGYVAYPNIILAQEKYDLLQWKNTYVAVITNAPVKNTFFLKDLKADKCFEKYPLVDEKHNYRKYLGR